MAQSGEHRMLFDLRGRRKRVIQVVYAILAILMAASLFLVVGPLNVGDLIGGGTTGDPSSALDDQAQRIERQLRRNPGDEQLLLSLVRTRVSAGNTQVEIDPVTQEQKITPEAQAEYEKAADAWARYMAQKPKEPSPAVAQLAATSLFTLAQNTTGNQAEFYVKDAAKAQRVVAANRPNLGTLSTLAIYEYFSFNYGRGDAAVKKAQGYATSKSQAKAVKKQLTGIRKRAKKFQKQLKLFAKFQKGQGKKQLQNPFGGLAGGGAGGTTPAP